MLKITIIAVGNKMPSWVDAAVTDYSKRLHDISLNLIEIPLLSRSKSSDLSRILIKETQKIREHIPNDARKIALDINGSSYSSECLAKKLASLQQTNPHWCFLIGGPEGLAHELLAECDEKWSLSKLTLPHTIARIVLIETLYRSLSILQNHPYHK